MAGSRESSRTTSEPPGSHELPASRPGFKGKKPGKFIRTGGFRCGSRTFAWTSHVSDWIVGRGTDKCRFSVELNKSGKYSRWGAASNNKSEKPWACICTLPPCENGCRFSDSARLSPRVHPQSKIKLNKQFKTLRWRLLRWRLTLSDQNSGAFSELLDSHLPKVQATL